MDRLRELPDGRIEKQCSKCEEWKAIPGEFHLNAESPDGFARQCKNCKNAFQSDWFKRRYHSDPVFRRKQIAKVNAREGSARSKLRYWLSHDKGGR